MRSTAPTGAPSRVRPCAGRASTSRSRPVNPDTRTAGERWGAARRTPATSPSVRSPTVIYYSEYAGVRTEEKFASRPGLFCGLVMLFDVQNAEPLAMINEGYLQHFRVGADAGIGTRYMAREDAHVVGIFGSGGWRAHTSRRCGASARSIASRSSVPRVNIARTTLKRWPSFTTSRPSPWMT